MTTDKTAVALRVLMAINRREYPAEQDVIVLRDYFPDHPNFAPDELACIVIEETVIQRRKSRENRVDGQAKPATQ